MYIKLSKSPTAKFTKVYLVEGYRDENKKPRHRIIKSYGNLEDLEKNDPDILEKLRAEAKVMDTSQTTISINLESKNHLQEKSRNYGYFFLEAVYEQLGISDFMKSKLSHKKTRFDANKVLKLLVYSRILNPDSKAATFEMRDEYFVPFNLKLNAIYRSLPLFDAIRNELQYCVHQEVSKWYQRDCSFVFYDVTNYYFETDIEDDFKKVGVSKENKRNPIVQMGLFIDSNGLPISYQLFPGNTNDMSTLIPIVKEIRQKFNLGRIILTADKGLNSGNNLRYLKSNGDGYIVSQKIKGAGKVFIKQVLDEEGYCYSSNKTFKIKSFLRTRIVKDEENKNSTELIEKVICFWSENYQLREEHKRKDLEEKLQQYIDNPSIYQRTKKHGIKKYIIETQWNEETGELEKPDIQLELDKEKYESDKELDGYYAIITSELELEEEEVIEKYRGLWKIEESFKVLKSDLEGLPVYVRKKDSIEGHFLICFLALLITRILELKLDRSYSIEKIQSSLAKANCKMLKKGIYNIEFQDEVFRKLEKSFDVSFDKSYAKLEELNHLHKNLQKKTTKK